MCATTLHYIEWRLCADVARPYSYDVCGDVDCVQTNSKEIGHAVHTELLNSTQLAYIVSVFVIYSGGQDALLHGSLLLFRRIMLNIATLQTLSGTVQWCEIKVTLTFIYNLFILTLISKVGLRMRIC